jgi:hypothetical protein
MKDFSNLQPGNFVRHKHGRDTYIVQANYGSYVIAARTAHISNPREWDKIGDDGNPMPDQK